MYYGHKNQDSYIPLCILNYNEPKKHYQLLYCNKNFSEDIFIEKFEENNNNENKIKIREDDKLNDKKISKKNDNITSIKGSDFNKDNSKIFNYDHNALYSNFHKELMVSHQNHKSLGSFENINKKEQKDLNLINDQII